MISTYPKRMPYYYSHRNNIHFRYCQGDTIIARIVIHPIACQDDASMQILWRTQSPIGEYCALVSCGLDKFGIGCNDGGRMFGKSLVVTKPDSVQHYYYRRLPPAVIQHLLFLLSLRNISIIACYHDDHGNDNTTTMKLRWQYDAVILLWRFYAAAATL